MVSVISKTVDGSEIPHFHHLRLVVYPHYLQGFIYTSQVVGLGISEPSRVVSQCIWFLAPTISFGIFGNIWCTSEEEHWNLRIHPRKRNIFFQTIIFRFELLIFGGCR